MTTASPEQKARFDAFRAAAYRHLDEWLDQQKGLFTTPEVPTLRQLSAQFMQTRATLLGGCLQEIALQLTANYREQMSAPCPCCGKTLKRHSVTAKTAHTLQGSIVVERPYFYCRDCRTGFYPLDAALELAEQAYQYDLQEQMLRLRAETPYAISAETFKGLTGLNPSDHCLHDTLNRIGTLAPIEEVIPSAEEITKRIAKAVSPTRPKPTLVVASDGAHTPTRPQGGRATKRGAGKWREVKGFRIYLVGDQERIIQIASWHQIQDAAQFTADLKLVAARIPQDRVEIALLGDGAEWLWSAMTECFPQARQVLDYYHCAEHIHKVAKIHYGDTLDGQQWAEATLTRLFMNDIGSVIGGLKRMQPYTTEAEKEIKKLITYLSNHRHRLGYQQCRDQGLPLGSGGIESANKHICHVRLKRSGAWWLEENGNTMLRLRCAIYNDTFDVVLNAFIAKKLLPCVRER